MKTLFLIISLCFSVTVWSEEITDFNPPLWNFGTGSGADAAGSGTLQGVPFTIAFNVNNGSKIFTSTSQHTSNATLGHGGPLGSLLLGGVDEELTITFATPVSVTVGLSHINIASDGWNFLTPADEIVNLHSEHETIGVASIDGLRQNTALGAVTTDTSNTSYFKWNNTTTIRLQTAGASSTTIALSSMSINSATAVPSLSTWGLLFLIGLLGFVSLRSEKLFKTT